MEPRKLRVCFASFPYGGNGGVPAEHPSIRHWYLNTILSATGNERIKDVSWFDIADTPITMSRNQAVEQAKKQGVDVLIMIDSDNWPDLHLTDRPGAKPFFSSSFDFLYDHYERGPVVIGAPYCGPPPHRNIYVFRWENTDDDGADDTWKLGQYTRTEANMLGGIQEVAALPTGLIMYDMRIFDIVETPYFYYEWKGEDERCRECGQTFSHYDESHNPILGDRAYKASTEDVTATRDMSQIGIASLGYNPVHCNWDAWAGHLKVENVGAPVMFREDQINMKLKRAIMSGRRDEKLVCIGHGGNGKSS